MTTFPDVYTTTRDAPAVQATPLDGRRLLLALEASRGPLAPVLIRSGRDLSRWLERSGTGTRAYDLIDVALREGVPGVVLTRIVGPDAASASLALDGPTGTSMTVSATEPGAWANGAAAGLSGEITNGDSGASR